MLRDFTTKFGRVWEECLSLRYFFPSVLILLLSILTISSSMLLSEGWRNLHTDYDALAGYDVPHVHTHVAGMLELEKRNLWSVTAMGLVAIALLLLNARKLQRLDTLNREKKTTLKLLEDRLAALEACLEGVGIVDFEGRLTYMNRALMEIHGIKPDAAGSYIGRNWLNLYNEKGRKYVCAHVLPELKKNGQWRGRSPLVRQDGAVIHAELAIKQLPDGGFIGTARDVTEQLRSEQEKKEIQDQLYHAQKMEAIGRLAGGIAHDFNNILAAMNGYAEFLIEDLEEGSEAQGFARNILQAGLQARTLVDGILAFSRRTDSGTEIFDLRAPLEECLSMLRASLPKTIEMKTDVMACDVLVEGNPTRIAQAIMNLCVNAKDAMEEERGVLTVSLRKMGEDDAPEAMFSRVDADPNAPALLRLEDGAPGETRLTLGALTEGRQYARLSIGDTGSGMSRIVMEHIFEPFFTTKPIDKGTGLGLPTVHGVIVSHGGALALRSRIGEGTRFDLFFPLAAGCQIRPDAAAPLPGGRLRARAGRVLLVEDQEDVRRMTETMLSRLGYSVQCAATGREALDILRREGGAFDLVLTDQNMPQMTGLELAQQALPEFPELRFVLLSGYAQERLEDFRAAQPAIRAFLRKPVSRNMLGRTLAQVLNGGQG